jgi:hypothetical protein
MKRSWRRVSELLLLAVAVSLATDGFAQAPAPRGAGRPQNQGQAGQGQRPVRPASDGGGRSWSTIDTQPTYAEGGGGFGWGGGWGMGGGTVAGNYLQGMASTVRAAGDYNLSTSQAWVNAEEAKRRDIENRKAWTDAYFEMRRANADYRAAERGPRGTQEDWVRYAKEAAPSRLSPGEIDYVTGKLSWPRLLQLDEFKESRQELDHLFADRAEKGGSIGPYGYQRILDLTNAMTSALKKNIRNYPANEYLDARKFLESVAFEARFTTS